MSEKLLSNLKRARDTFVEMRNVILSDMRCHDRDAGLNGAQDRIAAIDEAISIIKNKKANEAEIRNKALEDLCDKIKNDIFYFMVRNTQEKDTKSYGILGGIKEQLIRALKTKGE